ncbi:regulator of chromosome condensation 1/beta-lactamase-inhibitor protein II [Kalaharituber pfeilii]|nr:regulator of chromosome condensation 1/beta-lactamase-inhibitor protein II [Kalaharituber pfeilii]
MVAGVPRIMASLTSIPIDILIGNILPLLSVKDYLSFSSTCKAFHSFAYDEVYWRKLATSTFRMPTQPLREKGWRELYKRLSSAKLFTWGSNDECRLGHSQEIRSVPFPTEVSGPENEVVVDVVAGGWSITILTASGSLYCWGSLSGVFGRGYDHRPRKLGFPDGYSSKIVEVSSGRGHILALSDNGTIWQWSGNFSSIGRFIKFVHVDTKTLQSGQPAGRRGRGTVQKVVAGWNHSAALVNGVGLVIWWTASSDPNGVDGILVDGEIVPGTSFIEGDKESSKGMDSYAMEVGEVLDFMAGDKFLVFLTKTGKVYALRTNGPGSVAGIRPTQLHSFSSPPGEKPMSYISGSFGKFVIFNNDGLVYIGSQYIVETAVRGIADEDDEQAIKPIIMPSLQKRGIVAIAFGDYHSLALTADGKLFSWGTEPNACGCLGLGPREVASRLGVRYGRDGILDEPMEISFNEKLEVFYPSTGQSTQSPFVFNIAAAGWHSAALVLTSNPSKRKVSSASGLPSEIEASRFNPRMPHHRGRPFGEAGHGGRVHPNEAHRTPSCPIQDIITANPSPFIRHGPALPSPGARPRNVVTGGPLIVGPNDRLSSDHEEARRQENLAGAGLSHNASDGQGSQGDTEEENERGSNSECKLT